MNITESDKNAVIELLEEEYLLMHQIKTFDTQDMQKQLQTVASVMQYFVTIKMLPRSTILAVMNPFYAAIREDIGTAKRGMYTNFDVWKYTVYNKSYGTLQYKGRVYDGDDADDRHYLIFSLLRDGFIEFDNSINYGNYRFCHHRVLAAIKETFSFHWRDNFNLSSRAVFLTWKNLGLYTSNLEE